MNKTVLSIIALVFVGGIAFYMFGIDDSSDNNNSTSNAGAGSQANNGGQVANGNTGDQTFNGVDSSDKKDEAGTESGDLQDRPATEVYRSAEEAFAAIKNGATNYDDIILEQFTELGPDCSWCEELYKNVKNSILSADTPADQKSYYAEILAISGKVDNIATLISSIENPPQGQDPQILMEALELTIGKDDVVKYLGDKLGNTQNTDLKESMVAAISNQGSPLAVNTLYKFAVDSSNPDGFYSEGTGLGEVIPDADSFGSLKDIAAKKDDYSHLAIKSLLNAGNDGLKAVSDLLSTSNNPDLDRKILKDAVDHVNYDEDSEKQLKDLSENSKNPALKEFAKSALDSFAQDANADEGDSEQVSTPKDAPAEDE